VTDWRNRIFVLTMALLTGIAITLIVLDVQQFGI
jgi:hypothetical protein